MISKLTTGASYFFQGFKLIKHQHILPFVIGPIILNIIIFYFGFNYLSHLFETWLEGFNSAIPEWLGFIKTLLQFLFNAALIIIVAFSFTLVANFIGSPFYGLLSERVEIIKQQGSNQSALTLAEFTKLIPKAILREIQKLAYYLLRLIPLILLWALSFIITPLAIIMPFIGFLFGAKMLAIQYIDYAYDNNQQSFAKLKKDLKKNKLTSLGFGSVATLASMVPLFNIIAIPAAVCGGTLFYIEKNQQAIQQSKS